jgi:hypothetical protein
VLLLPQRRAATVLEAWLKLLEAAADCIAPRSEPRGRDLRRPLIERDKVFQAAVLLANRGSLDGPSRPVSLGSSWTAPVACQ